MQILHRFHEARLEQCNVQRVVTHQLVPSTDIDCAILSLCLADHLQPS